MKQNVIGRSNHEYDYVGDLIDYLGFWINVIEYKYDYSKSTITEYDYYISGGCLRLDLG